MKKKIKYFNTYEITDLKDMIEKTSKKNSKKIAFREKDSKGNIIEKTYFDFIKDVKQLSTKLIDMGLKDKRIAVMGKNSYNWAISYLAATIIGIVVPIDKEASKENVREFLDVSKSEAIIADTKYLNEIDKFKNQLENEIVLIDMQNKSKYIDISKLINERK